MDAIEPHMLYELTQNGRLMINWLARAIGLSDSTVSEWLEATGVIGGYNAVRVGFAPKWLMTCILKSR